MSMSATTANWHWKNKDVTEWAKSWFTKELVTVEVAGDPGSVDISEVKVGEGDAQLLLRKSILRKVFEFDNLVLTWSGTAEDEAQVKGKLTITNVSHEALVDEEGELVFEWADPSPANDSLYKMAREKLPEALTTKLRKFADAMLDAHGSALMVSVEPSRTATPVAGTPAPSAPCPAASSAAGLAAPKSVAAKVAMNTSQIVKEAKFMAPAKDLYKLFTDENQMKCWAGDSESTPEPGSPYSIFGGNVHGEYIALTPPSEIQQTWSLRSGNWPPGHAAKLTITLEEKEDSTEVKFTLDGVPKGSEDAIGHNLENYYINTLRGLGFGSVL